jgi:lipoate-protein ligase B
LRYFELIVPCGIVDRKATSLEKLLERNVSLGEIKPLLAIHLGEVFGLTIRTAPREELFAKLQEFEQALPVSA